MKTHEYLLLLCSLIACATSCSELNVIDQGAVKRLQSSRNSVMFNYLRLNVTSINDNITFHMDKNDTRVCTINLLEEEDGTLVSFDYLDNFNRKQLSQKLNFRLSRPRTYLELSYIKDYVSVYLFNANEQKRKRLAFRISEAQTDEFTVDVSSASGKLLLLSRCKEYLDINLSTFDFASVLQELVGNLHQHWENLTETKKELQTSENSRAKVQNELYKVKEELAESQEKLGKFNETQKELDKAQEELTLAQSKYTTLMATTVVLGILLVILMVAVALIFYSIRWRRLRSGTSDVSGADISMLSLLSCIGSILQAP
ncbi:uncharacterized protein LOC143030995 [Oratosquilla oratoria]|uniref:uncharacterized protein LOC143030995 n=1 Tax=Oratosquilla oratoria TaxID=337810 RepID=UPI003F7749B3